MLPSQQCLIFENKSLTRHTAPFRQAASAAARLEAVSWSAEIVNYAGEGSSRYRKMPDHCFETSRWCWYCCLCGRGQNWLASPLDCVAEACLPIIRPGCTLWDKARFEAGHLRSFCRYERLPVYWTAALNKDNGAERRTQKLSDIGLV